MTKNEAEAVVLSWLKEEGQHHASVDAFDGDGTSRDAYGSLYGLPDGFPECHWIVRVTDSMVMIRSTTVAVVSKASGTVVCYGSLNDEG